MGQRYAASAKTDGLYPSVIGDLFIPTLSGEQHGPLLLSALAVHV